MLARLISPFFNISRFELSLITLFLALSMVFFYWTSSLLSLTFGYLLFVVVLPFVFIIAIPFFFVMYLVASE